MLKKKNRLPARFFKEIYVQSRRNSLFTAKFRLNGLLFCRYAVVVSKRTASRASARNRLRRQIYSLIKTRDLTRLPGYDIVILVSPRAAGKDMTGLSFALREVIA